jgi:hypothetical protein
MICKLSCFISLIFIIAMIYMTSATSNNHVITNYKNQLPRELQEKYEKITNERKKIYYEGYILGFVLAILLLFINIYMLNKKISTLTMICIIVSISFVTNYFYYMLHPKSDWMLNHIKSPEQTKAWLKMYKNMQYYYHMGFVLGIVAVGMLGYAFRCV